MAKEKRCYDDTPFFLPPFRRTIQTFWNEFYDFGGANCV